MTVPFQQCVLYRNFIPMCTEIDYDVIDVIVFVVGGGGGGGGGGGENLDKNNEVICT